MKKHKIISLILAVLVSFSFLAACDSGGGTKTLSLAERNKMRGAQIYKEVVEKYYDREDDILNEYYMFPEVKAAGNQFDDRTADIWHFSSFQEATVWYYQLFPEDEYIIELEKDLRTLLTHYMEDPDQGENGGYMIYGMYYNATPFKATYRRDLFDDMSIVIMNLLHSYSLTGDPATLAQIESAQEFICKFGWDDVINPATGKEFGGNDQGRAASILDGRFYKPICANEFQINNLLQFSAINGITRNNKNYYLNWAQKYYDWSYETFRLSNGLYGDYYGYAPAGAKKEDTDRVKGNVAEETYTYHQGAMAEAGVRMYETHGDIKYLNAAKETAHAAAAKFVNRDIIDGMAQWTYNIYHWFNLCLLKAYMKLAKYDAAFEVYIEEIQKSIDYAYDNFYKDGLLPSNFLQGWIYDNSFDQNINIMDAAAYAQYYFMLSDYQTNIKGKQVAI